MNNELTFRIIVIIFFILLAIIGVYHRLQAAKLGDKISRQKEGVPIMILLRLFGVAMWLSLVVYMINPRWMAWAAISIPMELRWFGVVLGAIAIPLLYWMFSSLGKNVTDTVVIRKTHQLITTGPYRFIRHPMYLFSFFYITGLCLISSNWFFGVTGVGALILLIIRTPIEEAELINEFGDEYRAYMTRTGRFFPKLL